MKVLFATAEAVPFYKTGGLADVSRALPDALGPLGHDVRVMMPGYGFLRDATAAARAEVELSFPWPGGSARASVAVLAADGAATTAFVMARGLFDVERPYEDAPGDALDVGRRFAFFCRAIVAYAREWGADIVHLNDWHTGLVPVYALVDGLPAATLFSIHNLAYQGNFPTALMPEAGIPADFLRTENGLELHGQVSFIKAGLALADRLATVSPRYAAEIRSPAFGAGLDGLLRFRRRLLHGVLNGIDTGSWNPATDPYLPATYAGRSLARKSASRDLLLERAGIDGDGPVLGMVTRLAHQKGIDTLLDALPGLIERGCSLVVLGSGDAAYERALTDAASRWPRRVAFFTGFDEPLSHIIYAGADFFLMPSRFEPCGLGQLIAQRYGTPPIARRTGGLADTIEDGATGFLFDDPDPAALIEATGRAIRQWRRRGWRALQTRCMREDHSWTRAAHEYEHLYTMAIGALAQPPSQLDG
jgi:starch synthase